MELEDLQHFFLVGGTALALQLGHRISVDIDLFTQFDFDTSKLFNKLSSKFEISDKTEDVNTLNINIVLGETGSIVKVDLIKYSYPLINPIIKTDNIRLLSVEDIIPMKLSAVAGRGSKKDFYDIYYLLKRYSFDKMFDLFEQKFKNTNKFHILKSLTYFDDAEIEPDPQTVKSLDWDIVKQEILKKTNEYIKR